MAEADAAAPPVFDQDIAAPAAAPTPEAEPPATSTVEWAESRQNQREVAHATDVAPPAPAEAPAPEAVAPEAVALEPVALEPEPKSEPEPEPEPPATSAVEWAESRQNQREVAHATDVAPEPEPDPAEPATAALVELPEDPGAAAAAISRHRFPDGSPAAVLAPADPLLLAIAAPVAAVLDAPLLIGTSLATQPELERLHATRIVAVGLAAGTEQLGAPDDTAHAVSIAAAQFVRAEAGTVRAFAIGDTDEARAIAGPVAAAAALRKFPVMVGAEAARSGALEGARRAAVTYLVGKDAIAGAARVPGGFPLPAPTDSDVANRLAQLLKADGVKPTAAAQATADPTRNAVLAGTGGVILPELPGPDDPSITTRYR